MAAADVQAPPAEPAPALPDYLTNPDSVLGDKDAKWRYGRAPDYSKTRKVFQESKSSIATAMHCNSSDNRTSKADVSRSKLSPPTRRKPR
jgi:hypothetical protein